MLNSSALRFIGILRTGSRKALSIVFLLSLYSSNANALTPVEEFVTRFYVKILARDPDPAGLADWAQQLTNQTKTGSDIATGFIFSQEFINRGFTDSQYVDVLYRSFFDREPDDGGKTLWLNKLSSSGADRKTVLEGFTGSPEFASLAASFGIKPDRTPVEKFVTRLYQQTLLREPDPDGLASWSSQISSGTKTSSEVANGFVFSQEFIKRKLNKKQFVRTLYRTFFGREPDPSGESTWTNALRNGSMTRSEVVNSFSGSQEFLILASSFGISHVTPLINNNSEFPAATEDMPYSFTPITSGAASFIATNLPSWATINTITGEVTGTPTNDDVGRTENISVTNNSTSLTNLSLEVLNVNDPPTLKGTPPEFAYVDQLYRFILTAEDVDVGSPLIFTDNLPKWASLDVSDPNRPTIIGTPGPGDVGTTLTTVSADDTIASPTVFQVTLEVVDGEIINLTWDNPTTYMDGSTLDPSELLGFEITYTPEGGVPVKERITVGIGGGTTWTSPLLDLGTYSFSVVVFDTNNHDSDPANDFYVAVN